MANVLRIDAMWDPEASVWVVTSEDVPGLVTEAATIEAVNEKLAELIPLLLEMNEPHDYDRNSGINISMIALDYGKRLKSLNVKEKSLERLIGGYPSHGFVIDRSECAELFVNVREPNSHELVIAGCLAMGLKDPSKLYVDIFTGTDNNSADEIGVPNDGTDGIIQNPPGAESGVQVDIADGRPGDAAVPAPVNGSGVARKARRPRSAATRAV